MSSEAFDVAVLGAGIGGLAVAALLARAGRSVVLLERARQAGGVCQPIRRDPYRFEAGGALLGGFGAGGPCARLCDRLGLRLAVGPCEPPLQVVLPRHRVSLYADPDRLRTEVRRELPADAGGWAALWSELDALAAERERAVLELPPLPPEGWCAGLRYWRVTGRRALSALLARANGRLSRAQATPLRAVLLRHGLDARSQQVVEAALFYLLLQGADECSSLDAAAALQDLRRGSVALPGGSAALVDALVDRFQQDGGRLELGAEVVRCLVERGRVAGAVLASGETVRAAVVVADVPPGLLCGALLPPRRRWLRRRPSPEEAWSPRTVAEAALLAVPAPLLPSELGGLCLVVPDEDRPPRDENLVFLRSEPAGDGEPTSPGWRPLSLGRFVPPAEANGGASEAALLAALEQVAPGAAAAADYREMLRAADLAEIWGRPQAAVAYAGATRAWLGRRGIPHRSGWPGLLVAGESTYPGRLVSNVVEGALRVADQIAVGP